MAKKILVLLVVMLCLIVPLGAISAQAGNAAQGGTTTPTPTALSSGLGAFFGSDQTATSTATSGSGGAFGLGSGTATPTPTPDQVKLTLEKGSYTVIASGPWYTQLGTPTSDSVYAMMLAVFTDARSDLAIRQIASGFAALKSSYPTASTYHVLLLSGPFVYDASTTSKSLQLLSSQLLSPDAFIQDVLTNMRTINLASGGGTANTTGTPTAGSFGFPTVTNAPTRTPTRFATRVPTKPSSSCDAPADKARLRVKNGYSGTMRFTIGGGEWSTHDFDIPADGQYHYIDMPTGTYTYSASIPGVGKANGERKQYLAGQCYLLTFQP